MSKSWDIVILGCGQLGGNLKTQLEQEKYRVLGVRRTPIPDDPTYLSLDLDTANAWDQLAALPLNANSVWVGIVTPDSRTPESYRQRYVGVAQRLRQLASLPGRQHPVVWVSSTAVFSDAQSGMLDEMTPCEPTSWRGQLVREAEEAIEMISGAKTMIRYTGLYSAASLNRLLDPTFRAEIQSQAVSNRMHREDAVRLLSFVTESHLNQVAVPELIHGVDTCSATYETIFARLSGEITALTPATEGRVIVSRYRAQLPELRYPSLDQVMGPS